MRMGAAFAALAWLLAPAQCIRPQACAPANAVRSCCASAERCCCGGASRTPVPEPGAGSIKFPPEHAAELAAAPAVAVTAALGPSVAPCGPPNPFGSDPIYLNACNFRC